MKNKKLIKRFIPTVVIGGLVISSLPVYVFAGNGEEINMNINVNNNDVDGNENNNGNNNIDNDLEENRVVDVVYNEESRYYEGDGLRFEISEETNEATIIRQIGFEESGYNEDLMEVNISRIRLDGKEYDVTEVRGGAFYKCENLKKVKLPNVRELGNEVFAECKELKTVVLPKIEEVGSNIFSRCDKLRTIEWSYIKVAKKLSKYDIETTRRIGLIFVGEKLEEYVDEFGIEYRLNHVNKTAKVVKADRDIKVVNLVIEKINIYKNIYTITEIGYRAFKKCTGLTGNLTIPNSVKKIGTNAFLGCNAEISIPENKKLYVNEECTLEYTGDLKNGPSQDVYLK